MTKIFIDCEYNGFQGELITMALVAESGEEFYEVLECAKPTQWVLENVIPVLNKPAINFEYFKDILHYWLKQFNEIELVSDWYEDVRHFLDQLNVGDGVVFKIQKLNITLNWDINSKNSLIPHNALSDARALKESYGGSK